MRRFLTHFGLQLLSVALATVLWFMIAGQKQAERSLRVALELQNIPEGLELMGEPPETVDVRVRGAAGSVAQLRSGDLAVMLDLLTARPGRRMFTIGPDDVVVPTGVKALHVVPATVNLMFEASVTKRVPVVCETTGTPAPGYVVGPVTISPAQVDVVGPESAVRELAHATTDPVSVIGARARVRDRVTIGLSDPLVRLAVPGQATVLVDIVPAPIERVVHGVPVVARNIRRGLDAQVTPSGVSVTAKGPGNLLRHLSPQAVGAFVDVSGLDRGQYNLPVRLDTTSGYTVTAIVPSTVRVRVR